MRHFSIAILVLGACAGEPDTGARDEAITGTCLGDAADGMATIAGGTARLGCDADRYDCLDWGWSTVPAYSVEVAEFSIDKREVTRGHYEDCVSAGACSDVGLEPGGRPDLPMANLPYDFAEMYCAWVGKRLPHWNEWSVAARGSASLAYPWGDSLPSCAVARYGDCGAEPTAPGTFPDGATSCGVFDMAGNVMEFVESSPGDVPGVVDTLFYYFRGGSFRDDHAALASFALVGDEDAPYIGSERLGFRCARSSEPQGSPDP